MAIPGQKLTLSPKWGLGDIFKPISLDSSAYSGIEVTLRTTYQKK